MNASFQGQSGLIFRVLFRAWRRTSAPACPERRRLAGAGSSGYLVLVGTGLGAADAAILVATGVGMAVPTLVGTGLAVTGDAEAGAVAAADGAAAAAVDVATGEATPDDRGLAVATGAADPAADVAVAMGEAVPAAAWVPWVPWVAGALAECDAAGAPVDVVAAPEQPASASPAATPSPVTHHTGPSVTRGVFECERMFAPSLSCDDHFSTGKYGPAGEKLCREGRNLFPGSPVYAQAGSSRRAAGPAPGTRAGTAVVGQPSAGHGRLAGTRGPFGGLGVSLVKGWDGAH
jgi:hypothetical protein